MKPEAKIKARGHTTSDITREMLGLAVDALVTGAATAFIAGGLVILLAISNT